MGGMEHMLDLVLLAALGATLLQAVRLQRALAAMRADRSALQQAVEGFDAGTRQAEAGVDAMRRAASDVSALLDRASALRDDLAYLSDRGEGVANRLDQTVRSGRAMEAARDAPPVPDRAATARSQAERNLIAALAGGR